MTELTRAEKMKQAGIRLHGSEKAWRDFLAQMGSSGGKKTGESKKRGSKEYYQAIGKRGGLNRGKKAKV